MKTQTRILDNRLYYTRKIELHRKGKKSRTVRITPILICGICWPPHPTGKCGTRPLFWWVRAQGRNPHATSIPKNVYSPVGIPLRRRAMTPPKGVKAPWGRRKSPGTETHSARSVPQITRPAEVLPGTWRGVRPRLICGIWWPPHPTNIFWRVRAQGRSPHAPGISKNAYGPVSIPLMRGASGAGRWTTPEGGKSLGEAPPEAEGNLQVPRHTRPDPCRR